jgi:SAM-dependent methyltransferase
MNDPRDAVRAKVREFAREALHRGEPTAWFEPLYAWAGGDPSRIPWADRAVNPNLLSWLEAHDVRGANRAALVVGCGLGDDAEELARRDFRVTAFDISPAAIAWCRRRFPEFRVTYRVADLLAAPREWTQRFDFVFEAYTVQSLPHTVREAALNAIANFVAPGGELLLVCRARDQQDDPGNLPWPLTRDELRIVEAAGLREVQFEDYLDDEFAPVRRFRARYRRLQT